MRFLALALPRRQLRNSNPATQRQTRSLGALERSASTSRVLNLLAVAQANGHDALVLGAWGCGNFANDPALIADLFRQALDGPFKGAFRRVTFAIIDTTSDQRCLNQFRLALAQKASPSHN